MESRELIQHLLDRATFRADTMTKLDCFRSEHLLVGLNCFEAGQAQAVHTHTGADKFYVVLTGKATFVVGLETVVAAPGDLVLAPAGVPHGVARAEERTILLACIASGGGTTRP